MKIDLLDNTAAEDVRIEIIPLVDVIFCILTFFILAAVGLTRQQAIDLDLPSASSGTPLPAQGLGEEAIRRGRLYVSVDAIGQVYLDQQPVTLDLLYDVLLQHQQVSPEGLIVLYASRDARYEDVVRVLDLLRSVGGNRVALATLPSVIGDPANALSGEDLLDPDFLQDPSLTPETDPFQQPTDPLTPTDPLNPMNPSFDPLEPVSPSDE